MSKTKVHQRRPSAKNTSPSPPPPSAPVVPPRDPTAERNMLLERGIDHASRMTLDDVVIVARYGKEHEKLVITGAELAHVLSLREQYNNTYHMADGGDVNLMLRGMAELLMGTEDKGNRQLGGNGAYFLSNVLDDLAAKLEASDRRGSVQRVPAEKRRREGGCRMSAATARKPRKAQPPAPAPKAVA